MQNERDAVLLPCPNPWCDALERDGDFSPETRRTSFGNWQVCCTSCNQEGPVTTNEPAAIAAWNTRTDARIARLQETIVGLWHDSKTDQRPLWECLDMTLDEYTAWVNPDAIKEPST